MQYKLHMQTLPVQYVSDLFINEDYDNKFSMLVSYDLIYPVETLLVLAGNIGLPYTNEYEYVLDWCSTHFYATVVVAGSFEYYGCESIEEINEVDDKISDICSRLGNVYYLNNECVTINNIRFAGTTLWSRLKDRSLIQQTRLHSYTMDYNIRQFLHRKSVTWLHSMMEEELPTVIVTNYIPYVYRMRHNAGKSTCNRLHTIDSYRVEKEIRYPILLWIHGRADNVKSTFINGVPIVSNCLGRVPSNHYYSYSSYILSYIYGNECKPDLLNPIE
jgi:hypothetical protein